MTAALEFIQTSKTYENGLLRRTQLQAVREVSFQVEPGEVFGLLGPNRAGKTTLVKILLSLCRPSSGEVRRLGNPLADRSTLGQVGYLHENHAFPRYLTAATLLEYYGALTRVPAQELKVRIPQLLRRCGLEDRAHEPIARFSKGMVQRLGIAQALINAPRLLVLDEPTEGLDLAGREMLRDVVREVRDQKGTVLLVSHAVSEVELLCDRVAVLVNSRLVHLGPMNELVTKWGTLEKALQELYGRPTP